MKNLMLSFAAAALLLSACGKKDQPAAQAGAERAAPGADASYVRKDTYFSLPGAKGGQVDLATYSGRPVLVMFFTETCPYCRKAAPFIQRVAAGYEGKGLGTVGICVQDSADAAVNFGVDFALTFPLAYKGGPVSRTYRTRGVPYIYLLDRDHKVYDVWEGYDPQYDASILQAVEKVLSAK